MNYNASKREKGLSPVGQTKKAIANRQDAAAVKVQKLLFSMKGTQGKQEGWCKL